MAGKSFRIGVVAPSSTIPRSTEQAVHALAARLRPDAEITFHPQCFLTHGHFAGPDAARAEAFIEFANDDRFDAIWFGRGGYGSCRIAEQVLSALNEAARAKRYLGYSDAGSLLAGLYAKGFEGVAHGPVAQDITRVGGEAAIARALDWLVDAAPVALEPSVGAGVPTIAFNMAVLSALLGTPLQPDMAGHVLMLEEVGEYMYRIDRFLFHITSNPGVRACAGLRLGRCSDIPDNDPDFARSEESIAMEWCERSGIPWLGRADIGHDAANKIVPFGGHGA